MLRRPFAGTLLLCYLAACTSWHVQEGVSPLQLISTKHPRVVRLTRADGSRTVLDQPRIAAGDSLAGVHNGVLSSVAVSDVTQVATPRFSAGKTIGLFLGLSVVAVGTAVVACLSSRDRKSNTSELQSRPHLVCRLLLEKKKPNLAIPCHLHPINTVDYIGIESPIRSSALPETKWITSAEMTSR